MTYVKENHWTTLLVEARSNDFRYAGWLQTAPVRLLGMPHAVVFRRDDQLDGKHARKLGLSFLMPRWVKEVPLELSRPDSIRADASTLAILQKLEPHQMLIPVLGNRAADYNSWSRLLAMIPTSGDTDPQSLERQRYYRLVQAQDPLKQIPPLSPHPLTWTTISHILWDDLEPDRLNDAQQQAMVDWLHWGGQLIVMGGAGRSLESLRQSFLDPYLPADLSGVNAELAAGDFEALSEAHPAPNKPLPEEVLTPPRYRPVRLEDRIRPPPGRSVFLTGLEPKPGATVLPLGDPGQHVLGVEWSVGRGRVLMLGVRLTEKPWTDWPGLDTFVRRVVLRRPEEPHAQGSRFVVLSGPELNWIRYVARDLHAPDVSSGPSESPLPRVAGGRQQPGFSTGELPLPTEPVGAWLDGATLPKRAREALQEASGLTIPGRDLVLKVVLAYVLALVPLNWMVCRLVFRRRELAWAFTPLLALGFAVLVERSAAYDLGFETACDEIDLLELQGSYPRAHVSRFVSLTATGRESFTISYPVSSWALALPQNMANALTGADVSQSVWQSFPEPQLSEFPVQPRSLAMIRAEQMLDLPGGVELTGQEGNTRRVVNHTDLELRDAVVVDVAAGRRYSLGTIAPGASPRSARPHRPRRRRKSRAHRRRSGPPTPGSTRSRSSKSYRPIRGTVPTSDPSGAWWPGAQAPSRARRSARRWTVIAVSAWWSCTWTTGRRRASTWSRTMRRWPPGSCRPHRRPIDDDRGDPLHQALRRFRRGR